MNIHKPLYLCLYQNHEYSYHKSVYCCLYHLVCDALSHQENNGPSGGQILYTKSLQFLKDLVLGGWLTVVEIFQCFFGRKYFNKFPTFY